MSILAHQTMTNHHAPGLLSQLAETIHLWRERYRTRRELAQWTDRDLQDIGVSRSDVAFETEKPFWRA
ncbi:MAG: DUF1127 domain-containing protein [Bradyrhizobium sp.]|uniref:DUF1127 domain-containing protein n=1 Tax=Bradyrhizobium sp. TaxID=376 RepID=UPI0025C19970|nr:DUF1127 domain-containing protein [Bradyrhizobium sp.]MBI5263467.1 DUF1127 domain-containing protein [Bradyrhizobium sp.]